MSRSRRKALITPRYRTCRDAKRIYHGAYRARVRDRIKREDYDRIEGYRVSYSDSWIWKEFFMYQKSDFAVDTLTRKLKSDYLKYCQGHYTTTEVRAFCEVNGCTKADFMQRLTQSGVMKYRSWLMAHRFGK